MVAARPLPCPTVTRTGLRDRESMPLGRGGKVRESHFPTETMMLVKLRPKGQITIPDEVRRAVRLTEGDYLAVSVRGDTIVLEPKTVVDASQAWFWQKAWQAGEREASEDIAEGRTTRYESDLEFLDSLD